MDIQEFDFWLDEAKRQRLHRDLETMEKIRLAMWAESKDFIDLTNSIRLSLMTPEQRKRLQDQAWLSLRKTGRA